MEKINKMNDQPLVAIVIPVYNTEKYIGECIDHILAQTYSNWVCYITDNASTDNTVSIIKEHIKSDYRFKLFHNPQTIPAVSNWNKAYSQIIDINAKYAKLEPADDWMFPEYIEKMVDILEQNDNIGACFSFRLDDKVVNCFGLDIYDGNVFEGKEILHAELTGKYGISGSLGTPLYRVDTLKRISPILHVFNEQNIHSDTELAHDVMSCSKIGFVYQVLSYIRRHNETETATAKKYNTYLNGGERDLYKRLTIFPDINKVYNNHRLCYAWFLLKKRLKNDKKCINWHITHLERPIKIKEYILSSFYIISGYVKKSLRNYSKCH
jgi:glycosyltransferase involved in cell wall biosynthesis